MSEYQEPWHKGMDTGSIRDKDDKWVAGFPEDEAISERIVACVNACKGIPNEDLVDSVIPIKAIVDGRTTGWKPGRPMTSTQLWNLLKKSPSDWTTNITGVVLLVDHGKFVFETEIVPEASTEEPCHVPIKIVGRSLGSLERGE